MINTGPYRRLTVGMSGLSIIPRLAKRIAIVTLLLALSVGCASDPRGGGDDEASAAELYGQAKQALAAGDYQNAIERYQKLESRFPYGQHAEQAQLEVAFAHHKNAEPELALAAADRFIRLHPTHPNVDYAYYLKGLVSSIEEKRGIIDRLSGSNDLSDRDPQSARDAFYAFRELATRFPESRYADDAKLRMAYLLNTLAKHDIGVARYYLRRGAYVAVVNRAKYVIENYQDTPSVEDALGLMAMAYREMHMSVLVQDTLRVLRLNYPSSRYFSQFPS